MERHRQRNKRVLSNRLVVKHHVQEKSLLVRQVIVIFNLVVDLDRKLLNSRRLARLAIARLCLSNLDPSFFVTTLSLMLFFAG